MPRDKATSPSRHLLKFDTVISLVFSNVKGLTMSSQRRISIAYTPDSDDAFYYYGLQTDRITNTQYRYSFTSDHIIALNRAANAGLFDVTAVSAVAYPELADKYRILSVGTSVGRGYGPVVVGRIPMNLQELCGKRVGIAGLPTTGGMLMKWSRPEVQLVEMQFDKIADAVVSGELDAGVMIHEELLFYGQKGLHKIADLGEEWTLKTGMPLPVGLNLIRRDLGIESSNQICDEIRKSLLYALKNPNESLKWACQFGRGSEGQCGKEHISMFANADSVLMPQDVRDALKHMMRVVKAMGICEKIPRLDFIDGTTAVSEELNSAIAY